MSGDGFVYFAGGRLLARIGDEQAAERAFEAADTAYRGLGKDPKVPPQNLREIAVFYLTAGDFFSGRGVCGYAAAMAFGTVSQNRDYCGEGVRPRSSADQTAAARALSYYQRAGEILTGPALPDVLRNDLAATVKKLLSGG